MNNLQTIFARAKEAVGFHHIHDQYGEVRGTITKPAAAGGPLSLRAVKLTHATGSGRGHKISDPLRVKAGHVLTLDTAIIEGSRVAQAGATVFVMDTATTSAISDHSADGHEPVIGLYERPASYTVTTPAPFAIVPAQADVAVSALPLARAKVDLDRFPAVGVRFVINRADQKAFGDGVLSDAALVSITMGLANAADACLLSALTAANLPAFTLAAAAAKGLSFSELRAIAGTAAAGAAVGADGVLRVAGVPAELTNQTAATIVGSFQRAAVAISDDLSVIAERRNTQGDLVVTCWANMTALLPDTGAFWKVA
ncbi:hypothetical protein [uncultured Pseudomonas sp.]|uniref:hypothetical protein n=1 Tax=uncultured Pseudomonas sp. TaxID=114707 RepID=UPI002588F5A6|nr:hypothetical protein [uncultured Pseudomonas sp.]